MSPGMVSRRGARPWLGIAAFAAAGVACERPKNALEAPAPAEPPAAAKPATAGPCRLLTLDEAGAFLRGRATASPYEKLAYASSCIWEAKEPRRGLQVMTSTGAQLRADETMRDAGIDTPDRHFALLVETRRANEDGTPVPSLGDAALWSEKTAELWVLARNRVVVSVSFHGEQPTSDALERAVAVAKKIVPRI